MRASGVRRRLRPCDASAGPYLTLSEKTSTTFCGIWPDRAKCLGPYGTYGKIILENGKFRVADAKTARSYYMNVGVISADYEMKIVSARNRHAGRRGRRLHCIPAAERSVHHGRQARARKAHPSEHAVVEPAQGEQVKTPRWMGNKMPLTAQLAQEELKLRANCVPPGRREELRECSDLLE